MNARTEELHSAANDLKAYAGEMEELHHKMTEKVRFLCDAWESDAKVAYEEDFNEVSGSITQITEISVSLADGVEQYATSIDEIEEGHSKNHVSIG